MYWLYVSLVPFLIGLLGLLWIKKELRPQALLANGVVIFGLGLICTLVFALGPTMKSADTEIWNGKITQKYSQQVSCSHSYKCNCYEDCTTDSKGHTSCTEVCQTCYEHSYDVDWIARTSNNELVDFDRVDRQGVVEPPRYSKSYVGEFTAISHMFLNYFRASTKSVLTNFQEGVPNAGVPSYPTQYDYYHVDKFISEIPVQNKEWEWLVERVNSDLGSKKQVNLIVMVTKNSSPNYEWNVSKAWLGGKKNDVIVIIGAPNPPSISWVRVVSWSTNPLVKIKIRDSVQGIGTLDKRDDIIAAIRDGVDTGFQRVHMKDQKFLLKSWEPSSGVTIFLIILGAISNVVGLVFVSKGGDHEGFSRSVWDSDSTRRGSR